MASELRRQLTWKTLLIIALAVGSAVSLWKLGVNQGLDLKGGTELLYAIRTTGPADPDVTRNTIEVVRRRADPTGKGVLGLDIRQRGRNRFMIRLPNMTLQEAGRIEDRITRSGRLLFCLVNADRDDCARASTGQPVRGYTPFVRADLAHPDKGTKDRYEKYGYRGLPQLNLRPEDWLGVANRADPPAILVNNTPVITGDKLDVSSVNATLDRRGNRAIGFSFKPEARREFQWITGRNVGKHMAIILDEALYSAPIIQSEISGPGIIQSGDGFERKELQDLILTLRSGSLPADIELQSKHSVGPGLGSDSIRAGFRAAVIGMALVMLLMAAYYLALGMIADLALALNLLFVLGALSVMRATLTLPGIAGLILTVGMAVDANVLILERIREERARGKTLRLAVKNGYERAFTTIIDANLTTLITAVILFFIGHGPIKGFATVLSVGIISSLFSALFVSRVLTEVLLAANMLTRLVMLQIIKRPHLPFTRARALAVGCSVALIAVGLVFFYERGEKKYDSDLIGGFMADIEFGRKMSIEEVRKRVAQAGYPQAEIQRLWASGGATDRSTFSIRVKRPDPEKSIGKLEADLRAALDEAGLLQQLTPEAPWTYTFRLSRELTEQDLRNVMEGVGYRMADIRRLTPQAARSRQFLVHLRGDPEEMDNTIKKLRKGLRGLLAINESAFKAGDITRPARESPEYAVVLTFDKFVRLNALKEKLVRDVSAAPEGKEDLRVRGVGSDKGSQRCMNVEVSTRHRNTLKALLSLPDQRISIPALVHRDDGALEVGTSEPVSEATLRTHIRAAGVASEVLAVIPGEAGDTVFHAEMGTEMGTFEEGRIKLREDKVVEMIKADLEREFAADLYRKKLSVAFSAAAEPPADYAEDAAALIAQGYAFLKMTISDPDSDDAKAYALPIQTIVDNLRAAGGERQLYADALLLSEKQRQGFEHGRASEVYLKYKPGDDADKARRIEQDIAAVFAEPRAFRRTESVGERVSAEMKDAAFWAIVVAMVAIVFYIWFRFGELKFGVGALVALAHDVLLTMGAIAVADALSDTPVGATLGFSDIKINLSMIGAFLTIVGYSLNDTIVVYDRIRENMGGRRRTIDEHLVNNSINQVLSRTLLTSVTTLVVVLALYILGGPVIHGFAFALLVGVVVGTYSSVFIASPILLDWGRIVAGLGAVFGVVTLRFLRQPGRKAA